MKEGEGDATLPMEFEPYTSIVEAPLDSTTQTRNTNGVDWQEKVYQNIKSMMKMIRVAHLQQILLEPRAGLRDPMRNFGAEGYMDFAGPP
ncbi:hypothetical protein RND71_015669 [Anisodus tanguticus]|uniref:Uncharacterized protein n=1 Tax=Anisodus tanguticus TaxID=243964 RepID=A0AAE1S8C4_9SOLA|nr:hypothetical protein RND71_015669 [Anisodus tanguticus]